MTICYLLPGTWVGLFVYAIYVGAYWGGSRTPLISKMEHFAMKKLANTFSEKILKKSAKEKKMNIVADKYPQANTVKILHQCFFCFKVKHVM